MPFQELVPLGSRTTGFWVLYLIEVRHLYYVPSITIDREALGQVVRIRCMKLLKFM